MNTNQKNDLAKATDYINLAISYLYQEKPQLAVDELENAKHCIRNAFADDQPKVHIHKVLFTDVISVPVFPFEADSSGNGVPEG